MKSLTEKEKTLLLSYRDLTEKTMIEESMLASLPRPVQLWLINIGVIGKEVIHNVYFKQSGLMKLKPTQKRWLQANAEQYITTNEPSFLWKVSMKVMPFIHVYGSDLFINAQGYMTIKIASLIPIVQVSNLDKLNESALQRFLLELPWYPTAALNSYISWENINETSAKATMTYNGVTGSAFFHFDEYNTLVKISALRYKDSDESAERLQCIGEVKEHNIVHGIKIPTKMNVSWMLDEGMFTWYKLKIFDITYNKKK
ncbi:DUF6920 family protein [Chengkuizengella axinellae]|uniref:Uncharacterized protein n=1 Tax=Chengkuizengella axinellae TaxID=3064388 RepID=A0ABT9J5V7_9BACL|nr:DUF6544 family protein [Chengkuizengella sp. 2205SS18-9]MDP5277000.1 hypothetical protein [Chengkuizengella sp. 2205SS18-9]